MRCFLVMLVAIFILSGCEKEPLQFFPQNQYFSDLNEPVDYDFSTEAIVVISLPEDNLKAIQVIDQYIAQHYQEEDILKYRHLILAFFKESSDTKRVYEPRDEFIAYKNQQGSFTPRFNTDDVILEVAWKERPNQHPPWRIRTYNFRNKFGNGCPYWAGFWLDGKKTFYYRDSCSTEQRQAVEDYFKGARADKIW